MIDQELHYIELLTPELAELLARRYRILRKVFYAQPIGRRGLARHLDTGERILRRELTILKEQGLINIQSAGVTLTPKGEDAVNHLPSFIRRYFGLTDLELKLEQQLRVKKAIVVPGNLEDDELVRMEIGRAAARVLKEKLVSGTIIAVSGGATCAAVAEMLTPTSAYKNITVVPARGGLGEEMDFQANIIAARVAEKLKGQYRLLHFPDSLAEKSLQVLIQEPKLQEIMQLIKSSAILVHGIGVAEEMARRRGAGKKELERLQEQRAVGELFGLFFNSKGEIVDQVPSLGHYLEDLTRHVQTVIAVAGGPRKARAIMAVVGNRSRDILVTDEGAAREIINLFS
ncbi:MAG: sugar-binding transcriptional regulator [Firmicutes bacterium]|nr:sugar-binding transcriptional regulator [Bacillota bacterium]